MTLTTVAPRDTVRAPSHRGTIALLCTAAAIAVVFFGVVAVPYLVSPTYNADQYVGRRLPLVVHILGGSVALFAGPLQLWLGLMDRRMALHRVLGKLYVAAVGVAAAAAYALALRPSAGWIFGAGLAGLATAWLGTTGMAWLAITRRFLEQHKEWMVRSYVVTFAFVSFRLAFTALQALHVGTIQEDAAVMAWACWSIPLLVTELILQGRKII